MLDASSPRHRAGNQRRHEERRAKVVDTEFPLAGVEGRFNAIMSASVITPDAGTPIRDVVVAVPGGNYTRWYWNVDPAVLPGYSCAEHLAGASRGLCG
jgi:hypothetical protein